MFNLFLHCFRPPGGRQRVKETYTDINIVGQPGQHQPHNVPAPELQTSEDIHKNRS